jgi:flavodoxin
MLFKMRVLFFSKAGNAEHMAQAIARKYKTTSDQIPPAYPSDNEKLLIICFESGKKPDSQVLDFCTNLTPQRARNVALLQISKHETTEAADALADAVKKRGLNVVGKTHLIKVGGLFKQSKIKQSDYDGALKWSQEIVDSLTEK